MSTDLSNKPELPKGLAVFDSLRAEQEPWLDECFVPPEDFDLMAGSRSVVIFGEKGRGKTAVFWALKAINYDAEGFPQRLVVEWNPGIPEKIVESESGLVKKQVRQIFDACAVSLLKEIIRWPDIFRSAPTWAQDGLAWFVQTYGKGDMLTRLGPEMEQGDSNAATEILNLTQRSPRPVLQVNATPELVAKTFADILQALGLLGVWVLYDYQDWGGFGRKKSLQDALVAFLSTLPLFENATFSYKLLLPASWETILINATGIERDRIDNYRLAWPSPRLCDIVEHRLILALDNNVPNLGDLCQAADRLKLWLQRAGGDSPREWLELVKPLVHYYLQQQTPHPLEVNAWQYVLKKYPPRLTTDETTGMIFVGGRQIPPETLTNPALLRMLIYLYTHSDRIVSKAELYYKAYLGQESIPGKNDPGFAYPKEFGGLIDSNIYRLRQILEPDPQKPVLLLTIRGRGYRLVRRW